MEEDNVLDLRHLIRLAGDDEQPSGDWKDYSESTATLEQDMSQIRYLDGKAKRRIRRKNLRKNKK